MHERRAGTRAGWEAGGSSTSNSDCGFRISKASAGVPAQVPESNVRGPRCEVHALVGARASTLEGLDPGTLDDLEAVRGYEVRMYRWNKACSLPLPRLDARHPLC